MASWEYCKDSAPHAGHEWSQGYIDENDIGCRSYFHCAGIKSYELHDSLINTLNEAKRRVAAAEEEIRLESVKHRRTIHQFYVNDDNAPAEDPECPDC